MAFFEVPMKFGTSGKLYQNMSDPGSMLFGGAGVSNSLGQRRDGTKGGLFGDKAQGIDWAGSPITAGTDSQGAARLAAILYGAWAGAGAAGAGSGGGAAEGGMGSVGLGASPGAAAGGGGATAGSGMGGGAGIAGGAAGGGLGMTGMEGGGASGGAPSTGGGASWNQLRSPGMGQRQQQPYQPTWTTFQDDADTQRLLAELLRRY